jgi:dipeptidase E
VKFYLSSFKFGDRRDELAEMAPTREIAIIPNALDFRPRDDETTVRSLQNKVERLDDLGLDAEVIDLRDYFDDNDGLKQILWSMGAVFVLGGNVFVLRQAMFLSGLDTFLTSQATNPDFLYSGYSAAGCVLAPSLEPYKVVGDPTIMPYAQFHHVIWEGLNLVDFAFMPHWRSDHPESKAIERGIEYCEERGIKYAAIEDGRVLVFSSGPKSGNSRI